MSPQQQSRTRAGHDPHPGGARTGGQEHLSDSNKGLARYRAKDTGFNQPGCVCACACVPVWEGAPMRSCVFPYVPVCVCPSVGVYSHVCMCPCLEVCSHVCMCVPRCAHVFPCVFPYVPVCVCVSLGGTVFPRVRVCSPTSPCVHVCSHVCMCPCVGVCSHAIMCVPMCTCVPVWNYVPTCVFPYIPVCACVCTDTGTHAHGSPGR